jgi:hypothetical protein
MTEVSCWRGRKEGRNENSDWGKGNRSAMQPLFLGYQYLGEGEGMQKECS